MTMTTGARYEITVDGQPRTNRDDKRRVAVLLSIRLTHYGPNGGVTDMTNRKRPRPCPRAGSGGGSPCRPSIRPGLTFRVTAQIA
jgi:hypothetical protein